MVSFVPKEVPCDHVKLEPQISPLGGVLWYITYRTNCMGTKGILQMVGCAALNGRTFDANCSKLQKDRRFGDN